MKYLLILFLIVGFTLYSNNAKSNNGPVENYCGHSASIGAARIEGFIGCLSDAQYNDLYDAIYSNCMSSINGGSSSQDISFDE